MTFTQSSEATGVAGGLFLTSVDNSQVYACCERRNPTPLVQRVVWARTNQSSGYRASNPNNADWSLYNTRELALSLPANNDATGKPEITGTALVGQILTATTGTVADADGLPTVFTYQWKRVDADGVSNPTNIGTDSANYTLTTAKWAKGSWSKSASLTTSAASSPGPATPTLPAAPSPSAAAWL